MPKDDLIGDLPIDRQLDLLLKADPSNRMAFEYLMTYYLMTKNLEPFALRLPMAKEIPGFQIPPLWNQAIVVFSAMGNLSKIPSAITLDLKSQRIFEQVHQILARYRDFKSAQAELKTSCGNTYFYYDLYEK